MKKTNQNVCPGCSRHCSADCVRCKRGRAYFAKQAARESENNFVKMESPKKKHHHKWERNIAEGGPIWRMLWMSKKIKKALRHGEISEERLLEALSERERDQLSEAMDKMSFHLKKYVRSVSNPYI